jgi:hypothetical protein
MCCSISSSHAADEAALDLRSRLAKLGEELTLEHLETVLCDFGAMQKGRFYIGQDIDAMLAKLQHPTVPEEVRQRILKARAASLPHEYLGELHDWSDVDKERALLYRDTGVLVGRRGTAIRRGRLPCRLPQKTSASG